MATSQSDSSPGRVTDLLNREAGAPGSRWHKIGPLVDRELRHRAAVVIRHFMTSSSQRTLEPEELVAELYIRLLRDDDGHRWVNRKHFFAYASAAMRSILIDRRRAKLAGKRTAKDGAFEREPHDPGRPVEIKIALERLRTMSERQAAIVELRFFAGMENSEIAELLAVSEKTVQRDWITARAWLYAELAEGIPPHESR